MGFINDVETFLGAAQVVLRDDDAAPPRLVADRILTGFEQHPSSHLLLDDGSTIYWGWQRGQAFVRSLAVYNSARQLELVAAVDDIPLLSGQRTAHAVVDQQGYKQLLRKHASWGSSPMVVLFARNNQAVATHYPLVKRWVQAAMLGFNADCSKPDRAATCGLVEQIAIPTVAYSLNCGGAETVNRCPLSLPDVPAARIGLREFRQ